MALALILLYGLATMTLKIALGLLLLRILIKKWHVITIYAVMAVSVVSSPFLTRPDVSNGVVTDYQPH